MWKCRLRLRKRNGYLGIGIALFVPMLLQIITETCILLQITLIIIAFIGFLIILWVLFWPLGKEIPPLDVAINKSTEVWGMWFTGDQILKKGLIKDNNSIKKIMVMGLNSEAFEKNYELTQIPRDIIRKEIMMLTKLGKAKGIEVKWYLKHQEIGLTLYEPLNSNAWCYWTERIDKRPRDDRTWYALSKKNEEGLYNSQLERFRRIWDNDLLSRVPLEKEYESVNMSEYYKKMNRKWWKLWLTH